MSNPLSPRVVGHTPIDGWVRSVAVVRDHVYLAYQQQGLTIMTCRTPLRRYMLGRFLTVSTTRLWVRMGNTCTGLSGGQTDYECWMLRTRPILS